MGLVGHSKMKRKSTSMAATSSEEDISPVTKKTVTASKSGNNATIAAMDALIDVQDYLLRDCQEASKKLVAQAIARTEELRQEMEKGTKLLLDALGAEKENLEYDGKAVPQAYIISVRCITGPYRGRMFNMEINVKRHSSCFIGRSTGRKFRSPRGLSMPRDLELSTSHAEIKLETTGKLFLIDSDSTNGTRIDDVDMQPNKPVELNISKPVKVEIGAGMFEFSFEQKA